MCGIVALFSPEGGIDRSRVDKATASLYHRGPDGQKSWIAPHHRVGLGHARLSIIDLQTGDQPIASQDEMLQIVVNGEFYGYEDTQKQLQDWGYRLRTHSDSEIALHLYDRFGTDCLHHLRGEFALALWDERNQLLFAARDRFGIKPLYYAYYQNTLYLASEIKAILAAGVPAKWDLESVYQAHSISLSQDRTFFEGIYQVPPGHYLLASGNHLQILRYWDFNYPTSDRYLPFTCEQDYIEKLRWILDESIRVRLRADVPVGCYLSGGLDSSVILGMASRHVSQPIQAFTLAFDEAAYDESAIAKETAARNGSPIEVIPIYHSALADNFSDAIWHGEVLFSNASCTAKYLMSKAVRDANYRVVLTGEGSDELFGGYSAFRQDMLLYNTQGQDEATINQLLTQLRESNPISRGIILPDGPSLPLNSVKQTLGFIPTWLEACASSGLKFQSLYKSEFLAKFARRDPLKVFLNQFDLHNQLRGREAVNQSLYLWSKSIFANFMLRLLGDSTEMAHSVEGRLPFLDHHVVELLSQIPVSWKIRGMTEKYLLREAARPFVTDTIYKRQKHPFLAPPSTLKRNDKLHELIQDTCRSSTLGSLPFYDQNAIVNLLDKLPEMDSASLTAIDFTIMTVLSACVMQERFGLASS